MLVVLLVLEVESLTSPGLLILDLWSKADHGTVNKEVTPQYSTEFEL